MKIKFLTESEESFFILTISLERDRWYEYTLLANTEFFSIVHVVMIIKK